MNIEKGEVRFIVFLFICSETIMDFIFIYSLKDNPLVFVLPIVWGIKMLAVSFVLDLFSEKEEER